MATTMRPGTGTESGLERVRFFPGQILTADDMTQNADWAREKLRRHNRFLHGWGVVCGSDVRPPSTKDKPWEVHICPGYLLTPQGDEIYIASEAKFDLAGCLLESDDPCAYARPCPPRARRLDAKHQIAVLAVRYIECDARPVRVAPVGCGCDDAQCDYSRTREGYEFCCLDRAPAAPPKYGCDELCEGDVFPCPTSPADPWVPLAVIRLPRDPSTRIGASDIRIEGRPLLYSARMLQELATCACGEQHVPRSPTRRPTVTPEIVMPTPPTVEVVRLAAPTISPASGIYDDNQTTEVEVTLGHAVSGVQIRYTVDGTEPTAGSALYAGAFKVKSAVAYPAVPSDDKTVKARAFKSGYQESDVAQAVYNFFIIG